MRLSEESVQEFNCTQLANAQYRNVTKWLHHLVFVRLSTGSKLPRRRISAVCEEFNNQA